MAYGAESNCYVGPGQGRLNVPHLEYEEVECIYVKVDGRLIPVSDETVAQKNVAFYQREGKEAETVKRIETRAYGV